MKKSGNQLAEADAMELQRIQAEQSIIQKHLESSRKQTRQHEMLVQVTIQIDTAINLGFAPHSIESRKM